MPKETTRWRDVCNKKQLIFGFTPSYQSRYLQRTLFLFMYLCGLFTKKFVYHLSYKVFLGDFLNHALKAKQMPVHVLHCVFEKLTQYTNLRRRICVMKPCVNQFLFRDGKKSEVSLERKFPVPVWATTRKKFSL